MPTTTATAVSSRSVVVQALGGHGVQDVPRLEEFVSTTTVSSTAAEDDAGGQGQEYPWWNLEANWQFAVWVEGLQGDSWRWDKVRGAW